MLENTRANWVLDTRIEKLNLEKGFYFALHFDNVSSRARGPLETLFKSHHVRALVPGAIQFSSSYDFFPGFLMSLLHAWALSRTTSSTG